MSDSSLVKDVERLQARLSPALTAQRDARWRWWSSAPAERAAAAVVLATAELDLAAALGAQTVRELLEAAPAAGTSTPLERAARQWLLTELGPWSGGPELVTALRSAERALGEVGRTGVPGGAATRDAATPEARLEAYVAGLSAGKPVDGLSEIAALRNRQAQALGFAHAWEAAQQALGLDSEDAQAQLQRLSRSGREVWRQRKADLDAAAARRWTLPAPVAHWLHDDPAFQSGRRTHHADVEQQLGKLTPASVVRFFDGLAMDARPLLGSAVLADEAPEAACLCVTPDHTCVGLVTGEGVDRGRRLLERMAAGVAHRYRRAQAQPWQAPHLQGPLVAAFGEMVSRALWESPFLRDVVGAQEARVTPYTNDLRRGDRELRLAQTRWNLVRLGMLRALYEDPTADLDAVWTDLRARHQIVESTDPSLRGEWAWFLAAETDPVSVWGELLGTLVAAMARATLTREGAAANVTENIAVGQFGIQRWFLPGWSQPWQGLVEASCGEAWSATAWLKEVGA